ncbi:hypothetical protein [Dyella caseinilytica]|nr:hypothetical protein [Dyella caseinilytica]
MKIRIEAHMDGGGTVTSSVVASLMQEAGAAASAMKGATGDDNLYQAMPVMQRLCGDILKALPAP